jgi:drug/metabolite transporter (DMT)-like permease
MLIFAAASVLHRKRKANHVPVHQSLCIQTLTGSVLFGLCAFTQASLIPATTREFAIGMIWLVLVATFLAYAVYYTALRLFPVAKVSAAMFVGLAVTLLGVWMTSRS